MKHLISLLAVFIFLSTLPKTAFSDSAYVDVIAPNGGEEFFIGDTMWIKWDNDTNITKALTISISVNKGKTYVMAIEQVELHYDVGTQSFFNPLWANTPWVIPDSIVDTYDSVFYMESDLCFIKIHNIYQAQESDRSDAVFTISKKPQSIFSENGESFDINKHINVFGSLSSLKIVQRGILPNSIDLYNLRGTRVYSIMNPSFGELIKKPDGLSSGVYFAKINMGGENILSLVLIQP